MGTTWSVQIVAPPPTLDIAELRGDIARLLDDVNGLMSTYRDDSQLSRFNAAASTDWVSVSQELAAVVAEAHAVSAATGGAFDVTIGPLVNLWGFGPEVKADQLPGPSEIAAALSRTGYRFLDVRLDPPALRKTRSDLYVDLSAIAKGYGVDRIAALLRDRGLADALVDIGGELRGLGTNARAEPWRIAVERPEAGARRVFRVVPLRGLGMATSGDYRNFFELDGVRYSHTIDPKTGRPVEHRLASVTVLGESAMSADAWATALLVLGPDDGLALAESRGLAALLIEHDGDGFSAVSTARFEALTAP